MHSTFCGTVEAASDAIGFEHTATAYTRIWKRHADFLSYTSPRLMLILRPAACGCRLSPLSAVSMPFLRAGWACIRQRHQFVPARRHWHAGPLVGQRASSNWGLGGEVPRRDSAPLPVRSGVVSKLRCGRWSAGWLWSTGPLARESEGTVRSHCGQVRRPAVIRALPVACDKFRTRCVCASGT